MERYVLKAESNMKWLVTDTETGWQIRFREGLFNYTQEVIKPEDIKVPDGREPATYIAGIMRGIGDWMAKEHGLLCSCDIESRRMAIWTLSNEKYWITLAAAVNGLWLDMEGETADVLLSEIDDYLCLTNQNPAGLGDEERVNLIGSLSLLDDECAEEVCNILETFWNEYNGQDIDITIWARDLLWWPAWANHVEGEENLDEEL